MIQNHNIMVEFFSVEKDKVITEIWTFLLDEQEALLSGYLKGCKNNETAIDVMILCLRARIGNNRNSSAAFSVHCSWAIFLY